MLESLKLGGSLKQSHMLSNRLSVLGCDGIDRDQVFGPGEFADYCDFTDLIVLKTRIFRKSAEV